MKKATEIYKGVPLTNGRTEEIIEFIICNRDKMSAGDMAKEVGLKSYVPIAHIIRYLNKNKPKVVVKEAKNTFTNYCGSAKEKARNLIAESIMQTKRQSSNILTLPAENWMMEKNILKKKSGYKFTAVERDKETFLKMVRNMIDSPILSESVIGMENKTVAEQVVNDCADTYSSMILDYCGTIDSFYDEINNIMQRNLVKKGGYITLTLSENDRLLNHSHHTTNHSNTYIKNCCADEEMNGAKVTNDLVNILVYNNKGYKTVNKFPYKDKTVKMLLFIIKRIED